MESPTSADRGEPRAETDLERRLREERNVWVATSRGDGSPHLTPIWFVHVGGAIWICTERGNVKSRNVRRRPAVALALEDGDRPVVLEGTVQVHERPYPEDVVAAFRSKFDWDIARGDDDGEYAALWEIRPERWLMGGP